MLGALCSLSPLMTSSSACEVQSITLFRRLQDHCRSRLLAKDAANSAAICCFCAIDDRFQRACKPFAVSSQIPSQVSLWLSCDLSSMAFSVPVASNLCSPILTDSQSEAAALACITIHRLHPVGHLLHRRPRCLQDVRDSQKRARSSLREMI